VPRAMEFDPPFAAWTRYSSGPIWRGPALGEVVLRSDIRARRDEPRASWEWPAVSLSGHCTLPPGTRREVRCARPPALRSAQFDPAQTQCSPGDLHSRSILRVVRGAPQAPLKQTGGGRTEGVHASEADRWPPGPSGRFRRDPAKLPVLVYWLTARHLAPSRAHPACPDNWLRPSAP
jgi:hypothetical protein